MLFVQICVGSSCHLRGSHEIVELFQKAIEEHSLDEDVILSGCFCKEKCNRVGVTITIDDEIHTGITRDNFRDFFSKNILDVIKNEGK